VKRDDKFEHRRGKVVMKCPECDKEHLRDPKVVFTELKRFVCANGCATLKPKEKYW
jgi:hypothetical protein